MHLERMASLRFRKQVPSNVISCQMICTDKGAVRILLITRSNAILITALLLLLEES